MQQLRQALGANATLGSSHSLLASLLRASAPSSPAAWPLLASAAPGAGDWQARHGAGGAGAGGTGRDHDMLGMQSHVITEDHVGSALKLAMSSVVGPAADGSAATEMHLDGNSSSSVAQNGSQHAQVQQDAASGGGQEEPQARRLNAQDVAGLAASALSSGAPPFAMPPARRFSHPARSAQHRARLGAADGRVGRASRSPAPRCACLARDGVTCVVVVACWRAGCLLLQARTRTRRRC